MQDWDDFRHFLAVVRTGTLARAGAALRINPTTVGRRLTQLEERTGARLFDRTPEGYVLTPAGRAVLPRAERMEAEALALDRELTGADQRLTGTVRVSVTEMLATRFLTPRLREFAQRHPEITIDLNCTSRSVSLARREADIALRLSRPVEDNVVTRALGSIPLALYASRAYLDEHGAPEDADTTLHGHAVVLFAASRMFRLENDWMEPRLEGTRVALRSDSVSSIYAATEAGMGIALLPRAVADGEPGLARIPTASAPEPRVVWQTVHSDLHKTARVRAVLAFLAEILNAPDANVPSPPSGSARDR